MHGLSRVLLLPQDEQPSDPIVTRQATRVTGRPATLQPPSLFSCSSPLTPPSMLHSLSACCTAFCPVFMMPHTFPPRPDVWRRRKRLAWSRDLLRCTVVSVPHSDHLNTLQLYKVANLKQAHSPGSPSPLRMEHRPRTRKRHYEYAPERQQVGDRMPQVTCGANTRSAGRHGEPLPLPAAAPSCSLQRSEVTRTLPKTAHLSSLSVEERCT